MTGVLKDYRGSGEGFDPADDDYYEEIDRRMAEQFPKSLDKPPKKWQPKPP